MATGQLFTVYMGLADNFEYWILLAIWISGMPIIIFAPKHRKAGGYVFWIAAVCFFVPSMLNAQIKWFPLMFSYLTPLPTAIFQRPEMTTELFISLFAGVLVLLIRRWEFFYQDILGRQIPAGQVRQLTFVHISIISLLVVLWVFSFLFLLITVFYLNNLATTLSWDVSPYILLMTGGGVLVFACVLILGLPKSNR